MNQATNLWGIHAGETGDADALFLQHSVVALGWKEMGDLTTLKQDRDEFKKRLAQCRPNTKPGAIPVNAGQLFRFVHEMQQGDMVAYPSKQDRQVHIGRVDGGYKYNPGVEPGYPHHRPVKWLKHVPRTVFTQGAIYEIGSAMSLFQIKNYADEFRAELEGKAVPTPVAADTTVGHVTASIEEATRDFILKRLSQELKGHPLAEFVGHLLGTMGYRSRISLPGPDGGIDIIAHKDELGFEPPIVKVQVKSTSGSVGLPEVSALMGTLAPGEYALVVTLGTFTPPVKPFAKGKSNLRLIDGTDLVDLVMLHYEQFDSRYKGLLPLKRVYVPEAIEEASE
jgi:restriction system protein